MPDCSVYLLLSSIHIQPYLLVLQCSSTYYWTRAIPESFFVIYHCFPSRSRLEEAKSSFPGCAGGGRTDVATAELIRKEAHPVE